VLGYPIETVLAEKLATAIMPGAANTRVRDYADIYTLTGRRDLLHGAVRAALDATARFRGVEIAPLSSVGGRSCRVAGADLPCVPGGAWCRRR